MKAIYLVAATAVANCSAIEAALEEIEQEAIAEARDFSHAGMAYDYATDSFSGLTPTDVNNMPVTGTAIYNGEYTASVSDLGSGTGTGDGDAVVTAYFGASTAQLELTGALTATLKGQIAGNEIRKPPLSFSITGFTGTFYGTNASRIAGEFAGYDQNSDYVSGAYIVKK